MKAHKTITFLIFPLLYKIFLLTVIGGVFFAFAGASQKEVVDEEFRTEWDSFCQALASIEQFAPQDLPMQDIVYGGIRGMLNTLDPHTHFLDKDSFRYMQEEQEGSFYGIGISFDISADGYIRVVAPIEGSPAHSLGIRAGDRIVKINGDSTKNITEIEVIRKLRGKKGSSVVVTVQREGQEELKDFTIIRNKISLFTVRDPYMIRPGVGYIKITQFSKPTVEEFSKAIETLQKEGMKKLLIDLRNNPGGLLDQAVELADLFLNKKEAIVSTEGRIENSQMIFEAREAINYEDLPIIILVNGASASASEIVSGALQDLDRALVVGTRTYGKGLVQRQYPLPLNTAIQITTAQYFTPSRRPIQRPYFTPHENYLKRLHSPLGVKEEEQPSYFSRGGRPLKGGGGIVPDIIIEPKIADIILKFFAKDLFFNFSVQHFSKYDTIPRDFSIDDKIFLAFKDYVKESGLEFKEEEWEDNSDTIKLWILQEVISARYGLEEKLKIANEHDKQLLEALNLFDQAEEIIELYKESADKQS